MSEQDDVPGFGSESFQKGAHEAFGTYLESLARYGGSSSSNSNVASANARSLPDKDDGRPDGDPEQPKSLFLDPFALMDTLGVGYRATPQSISFETLRTISEKDVIIAAIVGKRVDQISTFTRRQPTKYSVGFEVHRRGRHRGRRLSQSEREKADYIENFILHTGRDPNPEGDNFTSFSKKIVRDSLVYDAAAFEKTKTFGGDPHSFFAIDGATIRFPSPKNSAGTPPSVREAKSRVAYAQYVSGQIWREFTSDQLAYLIRNPRSNVRVYRYGFPEIEVLINTVTSHLWAEAWNRNVFANGSTIKGFVNIQGKVSQEKLASLQRLWDSQAVGTQNAHRLPFINADGLQFIPLQWNNQEMGYQAWLEYLIKIMSAIYNIDPAEIQFDIRGGVGQQPMFMSSNEAQQKVSRDQGLSPLLHWYADAINRHVVWQIDPEYELYFVGLDAKTEEQNMELRAQQVQTTHMLNEVRALDGLAPVPDGDIVLNPVFVGYLAQKQQMAMAQQQAGGAAPGGPAGSDEPPPTEEDRAFFSKPGEEERQATGRLMEFNKLGDAGAGKKDDDASEFDRLFQDDWTSDVHAAQKPGDLAKSFYEVLPLD